MYSRDAEEWHTPPHWKQQRAAKTGANEELDDGAATLAIDIVATQGASLVSPPSTPVFPHYNEEEFVATLVAKLNSLVSVVQRCRRIKYGQEADEWPIGRTPPKLKRAFEELEERHAAIEEVEDSNEGDNDVADSTATPTVDIVAAQGTYLVAPPNTPVYPHYNKEEFIATLVAKLNSLVCVIQRCRRIKYGQEADEWPVGRTPLKLKRAFEELPDIASDEDDDGATDDVEKSPTKPKRTSRGRSQEARWLPTPPLSTHNPVPEPRKKKQRVPTTSGREDEGKEEGKEIDTTSTTARMDSSQEDIPKRLPKNTRKRRGPDDDEASKRQHIGNL